MVDVPKVGHFAPTARRHLDQSPTRAEQPQGLQGQSVQEWVAVSLLPNQYSCLFAWRFCKQINLRPITSEREFNSSITCLFVFVMGGMPNDTFLVNGKIKLLATS